VLARTFSLNARIPVKKALKVFKVRFSCIWDMFGNAVSLCRDGRNRFPTESPFHSQQKLEPGRCVWSSQIPLTA